MAESEYEGYAIIAVAKEQTVVYYQEFGSYQGEWILVSKDENWYYIYKDWYGSCSCCDQFQAEFGYDEDIEPSSAKVKKFAEDYHPFAIVPISVMARMAKENTIKEIFPANIRDEYDEIKYDEVIAEISKKILEEK